MFSSCSNEIIMIIPRKISPGFVLCDALKFLIYKKTDGVLPSEKTSEMRSAQTPFGARAIMKKIYQVYYNKLSKYFLTVFSISIIYEQSMNNKLTIF